MTDTSPGTPAPVPGPDGDRAIGPAARATGILQFGADHEAVVAVVVTHDRAELLAKSLEVLAAQTRPVDAIVVVDNANQAAVEALVTALPNGVYLPSEFNLGGAGGFALGMLHALAMGADWIWLADDDGRPEGPRVLATLLEAAERHGLAEVSPVVATIDDPETLAFPLRRGLVWRRERSELIDPGAPSDDVLMGIASLFNGALFRKDTVAAVGVPDLRLFIRGDEVEIHRRLVRSGLPFGTCLTTAYLHPNGSDEFRPILGGRMHTQYPDNETKRFFTYRNRGYLQSQPGMRKLIPQEWARFGWFFLVQQRDVAGFREWLRLRKLGRAERFTRP
ncbi:glycosyltransferase family 2 protein [Tsukamurella sp. NPDC003166]|uniref:galactofuranosyltransferase GlfT1 n=1 Tax=Tsukamurella sp. NPDC003166 TaxID=3154444 RepID=UPI0033A7A45E